MWHYSGRPVAHETVETRKNPRPATVDLPAATEHELYQVLPRPVPQEKLCPPPALPDNAAAIPVGGDSKVKPVGSSPRPFLPIQNYSRIRLPRLIISILVWNAFRGTDTERESSSGLASLTWIQFRTLKKEDTAAMTRTQSERVLYNWLLSALQPSVEYKCLCCTLVARCETGEAKGLRSPGAAKSTIGDGGSRRCYCLGPAGCRSQIIGSSHL